MANNLAVTGNVTIGGTLVVTGTTNLGAAADTVLVTNFNADKVDGADLSTDGTLAANSDVLVPSQKAVKTYADTKAADNAVVKLTGNQTVAGVKTLSDGAKIGEIGVILKTKILTFTFSDAPIAGAAHGLDASKIRGISGAVSHADYKLTAIQLTTTEVFLDMSMNVTATGYAIVFYVP